MEKAYKELNGLFIAAIMLVLRGFTFSKLWEWLIWTSPHWYSISVGGSCLLMIKEYLYIVVRVIINGGM